MPKKVLPRIAAVSPGDRPMTLRVRWEKDGESLIDVSGMLASYKVYAPLRHSPELFGKVQVGEYGTDIVWTDEIDMSADTLWRLAQEQSGATMTANEFRQWRKRKAYTLEGAARALGIGRRMVAYYEQGDRAIPRLVALATRGLDNADDSTELTLPGAVLRRSARLTVEDTNVLDTALFAVGRHAVSYVRTDQVASLFTAASGAWHSIDEAVKAGKPVRIGDIVKSPKKASLIERMFEGKRVRKSDLEKVLTPIERRVPA
jgi:DNA-binding transcriptional regulator YiaG